MRISHRDQDPHTSHLCPFQAERNRCTIAAANQEQVSLGLAHMTWGPIPVHVTWGKALRPGASISLRGRGWQDEKIATAPRRWLPVQADPSPSPRATQSRRNGPSAPQGSTNRVASENLRPQVREAGDSPLPTLVITKTHCRVPILPAEGTVAPRAVLRSPQAPSVGKIPYPQKTHCPSPQDGAGDPYKLPTSLFWPVLAPYLHQIALPLSLQLIQDTSSSLANARGWVRTLRSFHSAHLGLPVIDL